MQKNNITGLVIATKFEAKPFLKGLAPEQISVKPFPVYKRGTLLLVVSGIGKVNAALAASVLIRDYDAFRIINAGAAGAVNEGFPLSEIYHVNRVFEPDRPRLPGNRQRIHKPDILKGFSMARLATQDRPVLDPSERKKLSKDTDLVDMEGAAVVQACRFFERQCYLFKLVSDTPEHNKSSDIILNIRRYRTKLFEFVDERVLRKL